MAALAEDIVAVGEQDLEQEQRWRRRRMMMMSRWRRRRVRSALG